MSSAFSLGFSWFKDSCRTLKLQPLAYTGIVVFSLLMSGLLSSLPLIGTLLASLWMPFASVLTGFAARDVLAGRTPVYFTLIAIFRDKASRWPLLAVGILASIWMELDMLVFQMMGQADLAQWKITAEGVDVESIAAHFPVGAFLTAFALYLPLLLMTLFAPLLIVQNRQSVIKSLFYSFFGTLRSLVPCLARLRSGTRFRYFSDDRIHFHCGGRPHVLHLYGADPHCPHFCRLPSWHLGDVPRHLRLKPAGR
mgnify:CR=1 FL=1